jgi:hypothetical protein
MDKDELDKQYEFIFSNDDIINVDLSDTVTINGIVDQHLVYTSNGIEWSFIDVEPEKDLLDIKKIEEMCKEYPALEKAYDNFKTVYKMVEQDWIGKQKGDTDPPF